MASEALQREYKRVLSDMKYHKSRLEEAEALCQIIEAEMRREDAAQEKAS